MKVLDLTNSDIEKSCELLIAQFDRQFDLLVGIAEGGRIIAETIAGKLNLPLLMVAKQRRLTQHKKKAKTVFKYFPKPLLNFARIAENRFYEITMKLKTSEKTDEITVISADCSFFDNPQIRNVLIIDDAIDSGATAASVEKFLMEKNKNWQMQVAVITQTFNRPIRNADYQLYNKTLIRFPWSNDFKQ